MPNSENDESIIRSIQTSLAKTGLYGGRLDGLFGDSCQIAITDIMKKLFPLIDVSKITKPSYDAKEVYIYIQTLLTASGLYKNKIDGLWGTLSQTAFIKLIDLYVSKGSEEVTLPVQPATVNYSHINEEQFKSIIPQPVWNLIPDLIDPLNSAMEIFEINTPLRKAHFLAQILHETASFKYSEELASGQAYEGRKDLGNINPGDGRLFKGRGWLQITGRGNYLKCETFLRERLNNQAIDITSSVAAASQLAINPLYSSLSSGYFWKFIKPKLNATADRDDIFWVSVYVNGWQKQTHPYYPNKELEPNGMADRIAMLALTKKAFNIV